LNKHGDTITTPQSEEELRENVKHWLKRTIARIEVERTTQKEKDAEPEKQKVG
jgi:hypothetical protein